MTVKKLIRKSHLWLGLSSALILFVVCLSGSLFVFSDEIMSVCDRNLMVVVPQTQRITEDRAISIIHKRYPEHQIISLSAYRDERKSLRFLLSDRDRKAMYVFVDPYTGSIKGESQSIRFFYTVAYLHATLLLGEAGELIVQIATVIFLLELISGLIIWLPKKISWDSLKRALRFRPHANTLRRQLDLHTILGVWSLLLLVLIASTGLLIAFRPLANVVSRSLGGDPEMTFASHVQKAVPVAPLLHRLLREPDTDEVKLWMYDSESSSVYRIITARETGNITYRGTNRIFDKESGREVMNIPARKHGDVKNWVMRLHTGVWMGWVGKLLTFMAGLIGSLLSVTGIVIWWKKRR